MRAAVATDYAHFVRLFPELETGDAIISEEAWAFEVMPGMWLFERDDGVVAYAYMRLLEGSAAVYHVVVDPLARGQGVGQRVMRALRKTALEAGATSWELNVKPQNEPAVRLYRSVGMVPVFVAYALKMPWKKVDHLDPVEGPPARVFGADEDARLEAAFGLAKGALADRRGRGYVMLTLDEPLGLACFNPSFPGAMPFCVRDPQAVRPLLEGMRPHARPEHDHTSVFVQDNEAAAKRLIDAGAELRMEALHMKGPLA